jgi:DNA-dependent RNA polymerase auxiliary subunit epsilon
MLSLSPRYDLFRFQFPRDFIPTEISERYGKIIMEEFGTITSPIDYLNESIQGISFPGISDVNVTQQQHSSNELERKSNRLNVESKTDIIYTSTANPLDKINKEFKVTFRMNQGLYNYFMLYEMLFHYICKPILREEEPVLYVEILDESGVVRSKIKYMDCHIDGIDGLDFSYNKIERDSGTFDVIFKFNNIDFDFV